MCQRSACGFDTSLTARWGYRPLAVRDFAFDTDKLFTLPSGAEAFGADAAVTARSNEERYRNARTLMGQVIEMAHARGIQVAIGFEFGVHPPELASIVPPESRIPGAMLPDPTHPANIEILQATLDDLLAAYPGLDWVWLFQLPEPRHGCQRPRTRAGGDRDASDNVGDPVVGRRRLAVAPATASRRGERAGQGRLRRHVERDQPHLPRPGHRG